MKHTTYLLAGLLAGFAAMCIQSGCISAYMPPRLGDARDLLVVEGVIVDGVTTIHLSRSVDLDSDEPSGNRPLSRATVIIEGEE
ncbi:MAG: DUF4249 domain-containing protein, partial [Alistipes sp.]|nr:DUF4249 domain-containing protein [Alistipes sp.]